MNSPKLIGGLPRPIAVGYLLAFISAFLLYLVLWRDAPIQQSDTGGYLRAAQDLADFHLDQLQKRPPGYPLLLLLTHSSVSPNRELLAVSVIFHLVSIWLLGSVLYRLGSSALQLLLFCFILLLPPYVEAAGYVLTENLAEISLVVGFAGIVAWTLYHRALSIWVASFAIAYAALTRPVYQYLFILLATYLCLSLLLGLVRFRRDVVSAAVAMVVGSTICVGGYGLYNYAHFGQFTVSPIVGFALSTKTAGALERLPDEYAAVRTALIKARNEEAATGLFRPGASAVFAAEPELVRATGLQGAELSSYLVKMNLVLIRKAPLEFLHEVAWAFAAYWFPSAGTLANFKSPALQAIWSMLQFAIMAAFAGTLMLVTGLVAVGLALRKKLIGPFARFARQQSFAMLLQLNTYGLAIIIIMYSAVVSSLVGVGDPRYRMPTDSLIVCVVFLGISLWRQLSTMSNGMVIDLSVPETSGVSS